MDGKKLQNRLSGERRCYFLPNAVMNEESIRSAADIFPLTYPVAHHLNLTNNTIRKPDPRMSYDEE